MSQVLVWKSDADGKLFEDKKKYQSHLRKLARKIAVTKVDRELFLDKIGQVGSIKELEQFIKDNWKWFFANSVAGNEWRSRGKAHGMHEHVEVSFGWERSYLLEQLEQYRSQRRSSAWLPWLDGPD